ncbi:MAG: hypothetical protein U0074_02380 [Kouleothrix sp.]
MARGLLGAEHPLQLRHKRREVLRAADLVLLAGVACDFRLDYGRQIRRERAWFRPIAARTIHGLIASSPSARAGRPCPVCMRAGRCAAHAA